MFLVSIQEIYLIWNSTLFINIVKLMLLIYLRSYGMNITIFYVALGTGDDKLIRGHKIIFDLSS